MIKKVWAKFDDMNLECVCDEHNQKCESDVDCDEYVVKFTKIDREQRLDDALAHLENESKHLRREIKNFQSKVSRSIRKFKI